MNPAMMWLGVSKAEDGCKAPFCKKKQNVLTDPEINSE